MKPVRCLLQLQSRRLLHQSPKCTAQYSSLPQSASCQPGLPHSTQLQVLRTFHSSSTCGKNWPTSANFKDFERQKDKSLVIQDDLFEQVAKNSKTKATFNKVVDVFTQRDVRRRGHVEFIYAALKKMPEFGVERDLAVYNKLLDVFPKEIFVPRNFIQRMFNHYPRQQECGVQVLEQMEAYGVMPNVDTKVLLLQIFGNKSHPMKKYQRIMYWFPRFKHTNPFPVPEQLTEDPVDLARFSLKRIANDLDAKVTVFQVPFTVESERGEPITHPHIVGIQSPSQMKLLAQHDPSKPIFVEGPFPLWLRKTCVHYYILRAEPTPPEEMKEEPYHPERSFFYPLRLDVDLERDLEDEVEFDVEDLDDGPVYAMCMSGQGDQATLNQWISGLQETNPMLGQVPTLFRLDSGPQDLQGPADTESGPIHQTDTETPNQSREETQDVEEPQKSQGMKQ